MGVAGNWTQGLVYARQVPWLVCYISTNILFFLTNTYPTCKAQNCTRTFLKHTEYYIIKNYLGYYVINMKFFLNWIKYTEEVFRCVLFQINYLQKLSTNQRIHQILGEKKHKILHILLIAKKTKPGRQIYSYKNRIMQKYIVD